MASDYSDFDRYCDENDIKPGEEPAAFAGWLHEISGGQWDGDMQRVGEVPADAGPRPCRRCEGCGQLADTDEREPWTAWMSLPLQSSAAVVLGIVKPVPCDQCNGTGEERRGEPVH